MVHSGYARLWITEDANCCKVRAYEVASPIGTSFSQYLAQSPKGQKILREPKNRLDSQKFSAHLATSGKEFLMSNLVAYVDGGSLGNPGPSGIGVIIDGCESGPIRIAKWIGHQDNNVAEYMALMEALQCALSLKARTLHVYSDSQVVVRQMRGEYSCRSSRLYSLHWTCRKLARALSFSISHVPRENNAEANRLANSAVRQRTLYGSGNQHLALGN
jgi:ribonuclease HI